MNRAWLFAVASAVSVTACAPAEETVSPDFNEPASASASQAEGKQAPAFRPGKSRHKVDKAGKRNGQAAEATPQPEPTPAETTNAEPVSPDVLPAPGEGQSFESWLADVRTAALSAGVSEQTLAVALDNLKPSETVIRLDRAQAPSAVIPSYRRYLENHLTPDKIAVGLRRREAVREPVTVASERYGVPTGLLLAIWGMETSYGGYTGNFPIITALATLAYDGRRSDYFRQELWATLQILDQNLAAVEELRGSWAGAFGQTQFMPTNYLRFAVDANEDGRRNIWSDYTDVFASTANFLVGHGWQPGLGWGFEVKAPETLDRTALQATETPQKCNRALARHSAMLPAEQWRNLGITSLIEGQTWPADGTPMSLIEPDGPGGPAYLTTANYRVILDYNCSNFYALSVALLADALSQ